MATRRSRASTGSGRGGAPDASVSKFGRMVRLEVENFKTYKGAHVIGPFDNFTCIVGPNGCGKSNIMDAISFVLGLQARALRCHHMRDLIFRAKGEPATSRRRASVTLVYQLGRADAVEGMSAGDNVTFTRVISPSGQSTYRVNRQERSRDEYTKDLEGIGVIARGTNCLVAQGTVKDIGSRNPQAMLELFEQVSGSADLKEEYDAAKAASVAAEEATIALFQNRKEIVAERKEARLQSEEAQRFNRKLEERAKLKQQYYLWQLYHIENDITVHKKRHAELTREVQRLQQQTTAAAKRLDAKVKQHRKVNTQLGVAQTKASKASKLQKKCAAKVEELLAGIDSAKTSIEATQSQEEQEQAKLEEVDAQIAELKEQLQNLDNTIDELEDPASQDVDMNGSQFSADDMAEYLDLKQQAAVKSADANSQHQRVLRQHKVVLEELGALRKEEAQLNEEVLEHTKEAQASEATVHSTEAAIATCSAELEADTAAYAKLKQHADRDMERKEELAEQRDGLQRVLRTAKDARRRNDNEERKREALADMKRCITGVRGRLVDLCRPTSKRFTDAVTRVLGKHADSIVVDTQTAGFECMNYLRTHQIGSADFLPLDALRVKPVDDALRNLGKKYRLALEVMEFHDVFFPAVQYACDNAVVCDDMDAARHLRYGSRSRNVKVVTLSGAVIAKNGNITGGNTSYDSRLSHWEQTELDEARDKLRAVEEELAQLRRQLSHRGAGSRSSQLTDLANKVKRSQARIASLKPHIAVHKERITVATTRLQAAQARLDALAPKLEKATQDAARQSEELNACSRKLQRVANSVYAAFCARLGLDSISQFEEEDVKQRELLLQRRRDLTTQRSNTAQQLEYKRKSRARPAKALRDAKAATRKAERELAKLESSLQKARTAHAAAKQDHKHAQRGLEKLQAEVKVLKEEVAELRKEKTQLDKLKAKASKAMTAEVIVLEPARERRHAFLTKARDEEVALPMKDGTESVIEHDDEHDDSDATSDNGSEAADASQSTRSSAGSGHRFSQSNASTVRKDRRTTSQVDFRQLESGREVEDDLEFESMKRAFETRLKELHFELEQMQPNMKATERYAEVKLKVKKADAELEAARKAAVAAVDAFEDVKERRLEMFRAAFNHVKDAVEDVYKAMTRSSPAGHGGTAALQLDNELEPFESGVRYTAIPPAKKFREMALMSSGEKAVATLALLFAIHSYKRAPFFILDEIDANLDKFNVQKVVNYVRTRTAPTDDHPDNAEVQCLVISLKSYFYEHADSLVGVCKDQSNAGSSKVLTLDLSPYGHASTPLLPPSKHQSSLASATPRTKSPRKPTPAGEPSARSAPASSVKGKGKGKGKGKRPGSAVRGRKRGARALA